MSCGRLRVDLRARRSVRSARRLSSFCSAVLGLLAGAGFLPLACGQAIPSAHAGDETATQPVGEWRYYAHDQGSTKYTPLSQINRDNAAKLAVEWTWESPYVEMRKTNRMLTSFAYEDTPLMVGGTLYATSSLCHVAALDAQTGKEKWIFDPKSYEAGRPGNLGFVNRGVAYWTDGTLERIFIATHDAHLWAIDAKTGKPAADFGEGGKIDFSKAIPHAVVPQLYTITSPPVVCRNVVIVGSSIHDGPQFKEMPRGDVQAFDVRTGKPAWIFHTVPQGNEFGVDTWKNDSWKYTGNTNVWTLMTVDEETGYVYLPLSTPTNDWYGGHRLGDNLFADSLVCVDGTTGKRIWHFQTVHHGLWDYDLPAAPVLCTIHVDGRTIQAVAQITKTGFVFVFDRANGKPVWPIEERPVPPSDVAGEVTSPTQPMPTRPAPFERQGATEDNLIDFTPELRAEGKKILDKYAHGPLFTPPSVKGSINLPGWGGGGNWWGAAFDPETNLLYIPSITYPIVVKLNEPDSARSDFKYVRGGQVFGGDLAGPHGLPLFKPPYGRITAINLNTGERAWMVPHGDGPRAVISQVVGHDVGPLGAPGGGPLLTKTLLFVAQGFGGRGGHAAPGKAANVLRAFDKADGHIVATVELPAPPSATPMSYLAGGRQFIVLATNDGKLVGLSLKDAKAETASAASHKPKRPPIYNEKADAKADIAAALKLAQREHKHVLLKFGGNWCSWCYKLHDTFTHVAAVAEVLKKGFVLVLVDEDTNKDLLKKYAPDEKRMGFPYLVVLDADGKVLRDQPTDVLEEGPKHNPAKVKAFLVKWSPSADATTHSAVSQ
jgi:quinoprotein glucose dehydrogenase